MNIGLFHPQDWLNKGHWHYLNQTPGRSGHWKNAIYRVNDSALRETDVIVVHEDIDHKLIIRSGYTVLVTGEEKSAKLYNEQFINQFDYVITSRDDLKHHSLIRTHYFHPWSIKKTYDDLLVSDPPKTKNLSAVISSSVWLKGHKDRFAFINQLKGHYKDQLDWFSKNEGTYIQDKWDGLSPYRYSVAIENSAHPNYFTEKITDCYLAYTMPIYFGCPNINEYFDDRSFIRITPGDLNSAISVIDYAIKNQTYYDALPYIKDGRQLFMEKYHFLAALTDVIKSLKIEKIHRRKLLYPQSYYQENRMMTHAKKFIHKLTK